MPRSVWEPAPLLEDTVVARLAAGDDDAGLRTEGSGPSLGVVLGGHIVFTLLNSVLLANVMWLMPMLVRLKFGAADQDTRDWQTTFVTAALPTLLVLSIFWGELLRRIPLRRYILIYWVVAVVPLGCVGLVSNYGPFLACHVMAAAGWGGWMPLDSTLLKHFYSDSVRGRVFAIINVVRLGGAALAAYLVGRWFEAEPDAFRVYFFAGAGVQFLGILVLLWLVRITRADSSPVIPGARSWAALLRPVLGMGRVLWVDRVFLRYEIAFMTYGAAFMFCNALLPVLATDRLHMQYEDFASSTEMVTKLVMLAMCLPMGWLLDRLGPVRTSGISFAILAPYPVLLFFADGNVGVGMASAIFGLGLAGVQMGWTLGPVALAGSSENVPQYAAIHATLAGIRGALFQGLGMLVYKLTGGFAVPLMAAAAALAAASWLMWRLHATARQRTSEVAAR